MSYSHAKKISVSSLRGGELELTRVSFSSGEIWKGIQTRVVKHGTKEVKTETTKNSAVEIFLQNGGFACQKYSFVPNPRVTVLADAHYF